MFLPLYWSVCTTQIPYFATSFVATVPRSKSAGGPILKLLGGSVRTFGSMNRAVASVQAPSVIVSSVQARAKGLRKRPIRRDRRPLSAPPAAAREGTGLGGIGGGPAGLAGFAGAATTGSAAACGRTAASISWTDNFGPSAAGAGGAGAALEGAAGLSL